MKAAEFAEKLRLQAECYDDLRREGLSDTGARENIEMYNCIWKGTNVDLGDELLNLIANLRCSVYTRHKHRYYRATTL